MAAQWQTECSSSSSYSTGALRLFGVRAWLQQHAARHAPITMSILSCISALAHHDEVVFAEHQACCSSACALFGMLVALLPPTRLPLALSERLQSLDRHACYPTPPGGGSILPHAQHCPHMPRELARLVCRERLGGLPSSNLGVNTMTGALESFGPESYLGLPENCATMPPPPYVVAERQLGIPDA